MIDRKWSILVSTYSYGGNGACSSQSPHVGRYITKVVMAASKDHRVARLDCKDWCDTPITMTRNSTAMYAIKNGFDFVLMVDSDQYPDMYDGIHPEAKPFFQTALDFLIAQYDNRPSMIFAPYCGPAPNPVEGGNQPVYVFQWEALQQDQTIPHLHLTQFGRSEASRMRGIMEVAAGPTGLILLDTRVFKKLPVPWFYYEYAGDGETCPHCKQRKRGPEAAKAGTEDVMFTRNAGSAGLGVYCAWDCWAGHLKPQVVGRPEPLSNQYVSEVLKDSILNGPNPQDRIVEVNPGKSVEEIIRALGIKPQDAQIVQLSNPRLQERFQAVVPDGTTPIVTNAMLSDPLPPHPNGDGKRD